jgi:hypothetical protein
VALVTAYPFQEGNLDIMVDDKDKKVSPGEDAVFHWTTYNNDTYATYELSVSSASKSEFSESSFTLEPGESRTITQTIPTSIKNNNMQYLYSVHWAFTMYIFDIPLSEGSEDQYISVTVFNFTRESNSTHHGNIKTHSPPVFGIIFIISAILVTFILIWKLRKKSRVRQYNRQWKK